MRKSLLPLLASVALLLAACGKKQSSADSGAGKTAGGKVAQIFRVGNGDEPQDLDPQAVTGEPEHKILAALYDGLVNEDPQDLHPVPGLAKSWEVSADGRTYTFHLREGLKWSNGDPITAEDFVQSYKRMLTPKFAAEYAYLIYNFVVGAREYYDGKLTDFNQVGFKAIDPATLEVKLKNPTPYLLKIIASHYSWYGVPVKVIAKFGALDQRRTAWTRAGNLVGSGAFMLKEWLPNQKIVVVRNPNYWDAANVKLDEIQFFPTQDLAVEERMFRTGQLDMTYELPSGKIDVYRKEHPEQLHIEPWLAVYFYRCNVKRPPLDDKRVRRALALAIDRESLVKNVTRGGQIPAYAVSYPGTAGYVPRARLTGDLAEAKRLLAEAGYPNGKGCPPIELLYNTQENHRQLAEAIQAMWLQNLGVEVRLVNQEWKVYLDLQHTHNFQMQRGGWVADYNDPHVFLEIWETGNGNNDTNWGSPEYDRLLQAALAAENDQQRYEIYQKMDAILVDELPVIPIYYYTRVHAISTRVKGRYPTLLDDHPYKFIYLE
jgi:oligopeptide transport system substrate-binding protein